VPSASALPLNPNSLHRRQDEPGRPFPSFAALLVSPVVLCLLAPIAVSLYPSPSWSRSSCVLVCGLALCLFSPLRTQRPKLTTNPSLQTSEFSFEASGTAGALPLEPRRLRPSSSTAKQGQDLTHPRQETPHFRSVALCIDQCPGLINRPKNNSHFSGSISIGGGALTSDDTLGRKGFVSDFPSPESISPGSLPSASSI
jgi:hypothetical protein